MQFNCCCNKCRVWSPTNDSRPDTVSISFTGIANDYCWMCEDLNIEILCDLRSEVYTNYLNWQYCTALYVHEFIPGSVAIGSAWFYYYHPGIWPSTDPAWVLSVSAAFPESCDGVDRLGNHIFLRGIGFSYYQTEPFQAGQTYVTTRGGSGGFEDPSGNYNVACDMSGATATITT